MRSVSQTGRPGQAVRVPELDLLRFVAASAVVLYHYTYRPAVGGQPSETLFGPLQAVSMFGYLGVDLFFLISGFVIVWSAAGRSSVQFAISRFTRLYPMFWVALLATTCFIAILGREAQLPSAVALAGNATMLPGFLGVPFVDGVYWTLAVEMKFYALVFLLLICKQLQHLERWLYVWLCALIASHFLPGAHWLQSLSLFPNGAYFVAGALAYVMHVHGANARRLGGFAVCLLLSIGYGLRDASGFIFTDGVSVGPVVAAVIGAAYVIVLLIALRHLRVQASPRLAALGALTYPLYLLHNVIGKLIFARLEPYLNEWVRLAIELASAYLLAWLGVVAIEKRMRKPLDSLLTRAAEGLGRGVRGAWVAFRRGRPSES